MKSLYRINSFFKGIRAQSIILSIMIIGSVVLGIFTVARLNYMFKDYNMVKDAPADVYYIGNLSSPPTDRPWSEMGIELMEHLKEFPGVERTYSIKTVEPAMFEDESIGILLYPQEMLEDFPALKKLGYDFQKNPDGFIVQSVVFSKFEGESAVIALYNTSWRNLSVHINGKVDPTLHVFSFGGSGTANMKSSELLSEANYLIGLDNETNQRMAEEYAGGVNVMPNVVFKIKADTSDAEKEEILTYAQSVGNCASLADIAAEDLKNIKVEMKTNLPRPLFLYFTSVVAYLSTAALIVFKKRKELAIQYLCGSSVGKCISTVMTSVTAMVMIPCIICVGMLMLLRFFQKTLTEQFWGMMFDWNCLYLILIFFVLTLLLSLVSAFLFLRKKTPVELLRGAE